VRLPSTYSRPRPWHGEGARPLRPNRPRAAAARRGPTAGARPPAQLRLHQGADPDPPYLRTHGVGAETNDPRGGGVALYAVPRAAGEHQDADRRGGRIRLERATDLVTAEAGHLQVEHDERGMLRAGQL